jgi:hypothetical protein
VGSQVFQKQKIRKRILHSVQRISWRRNEILSVFYVQAPIQLSASEDWKRFEKENTTFREAISPVQKLATRLR